MPLSVELVSPEGTSFSGEADMVIARVEIDGDIAFQPGHVPFIGVLDIHEVRVLNGDDETAIAVHSGFVQVSGTEVSILSDVSEAADEIDVARAETAKANAEAALSADSDDVAAAAALQRAEVRLRVAGATTGPAAH
jgi:F-type H+-transporting ATPase subunit epsilon